jgi:hypothetical protein
VWPPLSEAGEALVTRYGRWLNSPGADRGDEPCPGVSAIESLTTMLRHLRAMAGTRIAAGALDTLVLPARPSLVIVAADPAAAA